MSKKPYPSDVPDAEWGFVIVVDTVGLLRAAHVTSADEQKRAQVKELA